MPQDSDDRLELIVTQRDERVATEQGFWARAEPLARAISMVAIPLVVALSGWWIQSALKERELSKEYVEVALSVLVEDEVDEELRTWAVSLLNENSSTKFTPGIAKRLVSGDLNLSVATVATTTIPVKPFGDFQKAIAQIKISSDDVLSVEQELIYDRYMNDLMTTEDVIRLQLNAGFRSPFTMEPAEASLHNDIQQARSRLEKLNSVVLQYADTLALLTASSDPSAYVDVDSIAQELRTNAQALAIELDLEITDGFFFGFGLLANNYLEETQQESLIELIRSSQAEMDSFANAGQNISKLSGLGIQTEYMTRFSELTRGVADLSQSERAELIKGIVALNEQTSRQLETLKLLHDAYRALPAAHEELVRSVTDRVSLSHTDLLAYADSLRSRYEDLAEE